MNRWRAVSLAIPLALLLGCPPKEPVLPAGNPPPSDLTFRIDSSQSRRFIHATIYGTNAPEWDGHSRWLTLARVGGNRWTAYNWENNASNAGSDWFFQNDGLTSAAATRPARRCADRVDDRPRRRRRAS